MAVPHNNKRALMCITSLTNASIFIPKGPYSMCAWFRAFPQENGEHRDYLNILGCFTGKPFSFCWLGEAYRKYNNYNKVSFYTSDEGSPEVVSQELTLNDWHFAVISRTANAELSLFVDGQTQSGRCRAATAAEIRSSLYVGARPGGYRSNKQFYGEIAHVGVWDHALQHDEIMSLYQHTCIPKDGLHYYWPMDEGEGTSCRNLVSKHSPLCITGKTRWQESPNSPQIIDKVAAYTQHAPVFHCNFVASDNFRKCFRYAPQRDGSGVALVFVNWDYKVDPLFQDLHDAERMYFVLQWLGFQPKTHQNCTGKEIMEIVIETAKGLTIMPTSFLLYFSGHGAEEIICGIDGSTVTIDSILSAFTFSNCPILENVPKIFLFDSCQGHDNTGYFHVAHNHFGTNEEIYDFLVVTACSYGAVSKTDEQGSFFTNEFVQTAVSLAPSLPIQDVIMETSTRVALRKQVPVMRFETLRDRKWKMFPMEKYSADAVTEQQTEDQQLLAEVLDSLEQKHPPQVPPTRCDHDQTQVLPHPIASWIKHHKDQLYLSGHAQVSDQGLNLSHGCYAEVPSQPIAKSSFTITACVFCNTFEARNVIVSDWSQNWVFLCSLDNGVPGFVLRRDLYDTPLLTEDLLKHGFGSIPWQDLLSISGHEAIPLNAWVNLAFMWNRELCTASIWVNGVCQASFQLPASETCLDLQHNSNGHSRWQIGLKKDDNAGYFNGTISYIEVFSAALTQEQLNALQL